MATIKEFNQRIAAFARELAEELGEVDDSDALSWLDAIETQAVEIGDAISVELLRQRSTDRPAADRESICPQCGQPGRYQGSRERELIGRRGPVTLSEPEYFCPCCRKAFFPLTRAIGVAIDCPFTPAMLRKVVYAGAQSASFVQATKGLEALAEVKLTRQRVERWTKRVGEECVEKMGTLAERYQALPLPERQQSPTAQVPPVACVMVDGGRIQVRDRHENQRDAKGYWKESLVGCCLSMVSEEQTKDPCPTLPKPFVDPGRMHDLSREIKGFSASAEDGAASSEALPDDRDGRPEVLVKSVVATRAGQDALGPRLVAEAHARGFHAARRKAFVAVGAAINWTVHKKHFSHYTPILDCTPAVCYVFAAAMAGRAAAVGWRDYVQ